MAETFFELAVGGGGVNPFAIIGTGISGGLAAYILALALLSIITGQTDEDVGLIEKR